jgi:Flp pilus assembly protein TadG
MLAILKRITRRRDKGEGGQSLVEFAFVLPIFLLVLFAIIDFGMAFHSWIAVTSSAREGGRLAAVHPSLEAEGSPCFGQGSLTQCIETRVRDTAGNIGDDLSVTVTNADGMTGQSVVVDVSYEYFLITPLSDMIVMISGGSIGDSFTLSSTADYRLE